AAFALVVVANLPENVRAAASRSENRRLRGRILEGRRPERAVPARDPGARWRRAGAGLLGRLPRILQAPQAGFLIGGDDGQRAPRDARVVPARDRRAGGEP